MAEAGHLERHTEHDGRDNDSSGLRERVRSPEAECGSFTKVLLSWQR